MAQFYEQTIPGHKSEFINLEEVKNSTDINYRKKLNPNIIFTSDDVSVLQRRIMPIAFISFFTYLFSKWLYQSWVFRVVFVIHCMIPMFGGVELVEMKFSEQVFSKQ